MNDRGRRLSLPDLFALLNGFLLACVFALLAVHNVFPRFFDAPGIRHGIVGYAAYAGYPFQQETAGFVFFLVFVPAVTLLFLKIHQTLTGRWAAQLQVILLIGLAIHLVIGFLNVAKAYLITFAVLLGILLTFRAWKRRIWRWIETARPVVGANRACVVALIVSVGSLGFVTVFFARTLGFLPGSNDHLLLWFLFFSVVYALLAFVDAFLVGKETGLQVSCALLSPLTLCLMVPLLYRLAGTGPAVLGTLLLSVVTVLRHVRWLRGHSTPRLSDRMLRGGFYFFLLPTLVATFCFDFDVNQGRYVDYPISNFDLANNLSWDNEILGGRFPWRDFYYPYGVNIFIRGALIRIWKDHYSGETFFHNLASAISVLAVLFLLWELLRPSLVLLVSAFVSYLALEKNIYWNYRIAFGFLCLALLMRANRTGCKWTLAVAGFTAGLSVLLSPEVGLATVLVAFPAVAVSAYVGQWREGSILRKTLSGWGWVFTGLAVVLLPFASYLRSHGALDPFVRHTSLSIWDADYYGKLPHAFFSTNFGFVPIPNGLYRALFRDAYYGVTGYLGVSLLPLLVVTLAGFYLVYRLPIKQWEQKEFNLVVLIGATLLHYKNVLTRSDAHVLNIRPFTVTLLASLLVCVGPTAGKILRERRLAFLASGPVAVISFVMLLQFPRGDVLKQFESSLASGLGSTIASLSQKGRPANDNVHLLRSPGTARGFNFYFSTGKREEARALEREIAYLQDEVVANGGFYSYPYASEFYLLLAQNSRTSYGPQGAYNAPRREQQKTIIADLQRNGVEYILHEGLFEQDTVPIPLRYPELDRFVFANFRPVATLGSGTLLKRAVAEKLPTFKEELASGRVLRRWTFEHDMSDWLPLHGIREWQVRAGELHLGVTEDPYLTTPIDLVVPPNTFLVVSMKTNARSTIEVFYDTGGGFVHEPRRRSTLGDSGFQDYVFLLPGGARLRQLRIDPVSDPIRQPTEVSLRSVLLVQLSDSRSVAAILQKSSYYSGRLAPLNFGWLPYVLGRDRREMQELEYKELSLRPRPPVDAEGPPYEKDATRLELQGLSLPAEQRVRIRVSTRSGLASALEMGSKPLVAIFWDKGEGYQDYQVALGKVLVDGKQHDYLFEISQAPSWYFDQRAIVGLKIVLEEAGNTTIDRVDVYREPSHENPQREPSRSSLGR